MYADAPPEAGPIKETTKMNTLDEAIAVLQAMKEGKVIQYKAGTNKWVDREPWMAKGMPSFTTAEYRVKPEPKKVWIVNADTTDKCRMVQRAPLAYTYTYDNKQQAECLVNSLKTQPLLYVNVTIEEKELPCQ